MTHISILLTFLYLTVAILLLVLCLATAWKRWIKLAMILVVSARRSEFEVEKFDREGGRSKNASRCLFSLFSVLSVGLFFTNNVLEINFTADHVSGGHHMVEIHIFDKRLDASSLLDFILAHSFGNLSGVSFDTGN